MTWGSRRLGFRAAALVSAAALVGGLTACAGEGGDAGATTPGLTTPPSASVVASLPAVDWVTFTTQDGLASWRMPPDWTATLEGIDEMGQLQYVVTGPDGDVRLRYGHKVWGLGGPGCTDENPAFPYQVVASSVLDIEVTKSGYSGDVPPRVAYETIQYPDHVEAGLGDTDALQGVDGTACDFFHLLDTTSAAGIVSFGAQYLAADGSWGDRSTATMDDAVAYVDTEEYRTLTGILSSLTLQG